MNEKFEFYLKTRFFCKKKQSEQKIYKGKYYKSYTRTLILKKKKKKK